MMTKEIGKGGFGNLAGVNQSKTTAPAWPELEDLGQVPDINDELLPPAHGIRSYIHDVAKANRCNRAAVAACLLTGMSGLIGNRACIHPYQKSDKVFFPNLWGAIVGGPSMRKSGTLQMAIAPILAIDKRVNKAETEKVFTRQAEANRLSGQIAKLEKSDDDIERYELPSLYEQLAFADRKFNREIIVNNATTAALQELFRSNPDGVLLLRDELSGVIAEMEKDGASGDREYYLELWDGGCSGTYKQHRITRGNATAKWRGLAMLGGTQPDKLNKLISKARAGENDGLIQRVQMLISMSKTSTKIIDCNTTVPDELQAYFDSLEDFLPHPPDAYNEEFKPITYYTTNEATDYWLNWIEQNDERADAETDKILMDHYGKYPSLFISLSLLFTLIRQGDIVELCDMELANQWCDYLALHARSVYSTGKNTLVDRFLEKIRNGKIKTGMTVRDMQVNKVLGRNTKNVLPNTLSLLKKAGYIRIHEESKNSQTIEINPNFKVNSNV